FIFVSPTRLAGLPPKTRPVSTPTNSFPFQKCCAFLPSGVLISSDELHSPSVPGLTSPTKLPSTEVFVPPNTPHPETGRAMVVNTPLGSPVAPASSSDGRNIQSGLWDSPAFSSSSCFFNPFHFQAKCPIILTTSFSPIFASQDSNEGFLTLGLWNVTLSLA